MVAGNLDKTKEGRRRRRRRRGNSAQIVHGGVANVIDPPLVVITVELLPCGAQKKRDVCCCLCCMMIMAYVMVIDLIKRSSNLNFQKPSKSSVLQKEKKFKCGRCCRGLEGVAFLYNKKV